MRQLPLAARWYLWAIYLACLVLVVDQLGPFAPWPAAFSNHGSLWWNLPLFVLLAYLGERTTLEVSPSTLQSLATPVHIAAILLFPSPIPLLIALLAVLVWQIFHSRSPLHKRAFNICHSTLLVGLTSIFVSRLTTSAIAALPVLIAVVLVYYVLDVGPMLGLLTLLDRCAPWTVWQQAYRRTILPELAASTTGILAAVVWLDHPVLLTLFVVPVVALRVAFRAIGQAEERATALHQRSERLEAVLAAGQRLQLQQTPAELLRPVTEAAHILTNATSAAGYVCEREDPARLTRVVVVPPDADDGSASPVFLPASNGAPPHIDAGDTDRDLELPLALEGAGVMALVRLYGIKQELDDDARDVLSILTTQATIALQNARLHERALLQASQDGLTGLLTHRAFQTRLEEEVARAQRSGHPLSLMMVDLDSFRTINNTLGHQAGDSALAEIASVLRESVRTSDVAARYGGDEFAVILPETEMEEALAIAARTRTALAALTVWEPGVGLRLDASIGVACAPLHATTREGLIAAADRAAYAAKQMGKGRVARPEEAILQLASDPSVLARQLENANMATVEALAAAVDAKDPYTRGHAQRVSAYAVAAAHALGLPTADIARIRLAGLLHDVGKIGVPDAILTKPSRLSAEEFAVIQQHPVIGERLLASVPFLRGVLPAVRHHHERWDGRGYPDGLAATAIPQDASILMVADSLDAMTSSRTYRAALPVHEARRRLQAGRGTQFDARVVDALDHALATRVVTLLSADAVGQAAGEG